VGQLLGAVRGDRSLGGQPHNLPKVLASLPEDEHEDIKELLGDPETDWAAFTRTLRQMFPDARQMTTSTWRRWSHDFRDDPKWWDRINGLA
jgi:hypothetical protein